MVGQTKNRTGRKQSSKLRQPCSFCVCQAPAGSRDRSTSRRRRLNRKERLNVCYNCGVSFRVVCSRGSLELHMSLCHCLSSHFCIHFITVSTLCFPFSASMSVSFSAPLTAPLCSVSHLFISFFSFISHSPFPLCLPTVPRLSEYLLQ